MVFLGSSPLKPLTNVSQQVFPFFVFSSRLTPPTNILRLRNYYVSRSTDEGGKATTSTSSTVSGPFPCGLLCQFKNDFSFFLFVLFLSQALSRSFHSKLKVFSQRDGWRESFARAAFIYR
jgi:hypothetical protein